MIDNIYREITEAMDRGKRAVLMTVIETKGSAPNKIGAKMLLYSDGKTKGTVGGGPSEAKALKEAKEIFNTKAPKVVNFDLMPGREESVGAICGGSLKVYMEPVNFNSKLVIFGGGHVGLEVCKAGKVLDFKVTVVDDREDFAGRERFPFADEVICKDALEAIKEIIFDGDTYVVIVTRGHKQDHVVIKALMEMDTEPVYTGMIGSRKKIKGLFEQLISQGIKEEKLKKVYSPIGLDTGGDTPAEIAVSIMAEILKVKYGGSGRSLRDIFRDNGR